MLSLDVAIVTGGFTLGGVALTATIDGLRRRHDERKRECEARRRDVTELIVAAEHLHDAVRLFRAITIARRTTIGGIATGMAQDASNELVESGFSWWGLLTRLIIGLRDFFKIGGIVDRTQDSTGARYQEIVTPPLQRLIAAATAVQLGQAGDLGSAGGSLQRAAGRLADQAQSNKRAYRRAESAFEDALQAAQTAARDSA